MSATSTTINEAKQLINILSSIQEYIELTSEFVKENDYLEQMNNTKKLYDSIKRFNPTELITQLNNNPIVQAQRRVATMRTQKERLQTDDEKMKSGRYTICEKCDTIVSRKFLPNHVKTVKCNEIYTTKKLVLSTKTVRTERYKNSIITLSNKYIVMRYINRIRNNIADREVMETF